jgi:hypothetical protein
MARFTTERADVVIGEDDGNRIRVQFRARCLDCGAVVFDKAARDAHVCPGAK